MTTVTLTFHAGLDTLTCLVTFSNTLVLTIVTLPFTFSGGRIVQFWGGGVTAVHVMLGFCGLTSVILGGSLGSGLSNSGFCSAGRSGFSQPSNEILGRGPGLSTSKSSSGGGPSGSANVMVGGADARRRRASAGAASSVVGSALGFPPSKDGRCSDHADAS